MLEKYKLEPYLKPIQYNREIIEFRQINNNSISSSLTSFSVYSVTGQHTDWTSHYYGITSYPYSVLILNEVYDNIIQGFNQFRLDVVSGSSTATVVFDDKYMMNQFRDKTVRIARLYESSTSITSTTTAIQDSINSNFIDYLNGVVIIRSDEIKLIALNYSSAVQVIDNQFICVAKANEFNRTNNFSALTPSTTRIVEYFNYDESSYDEAYYDALVTYIQNDGITLNQYRESFNIPYITGIGIYDDDANLLAVAKLSQPIKKSKKINIVFRIQIDM